MVIALLALFVSLAGTGIAATHYLITSTKQIKPSVLKQLKGARATLERRELRDCRERPARRVRRGRLALAST